MKYQDCLYRYIGVFEFAFTSDVDEFVVPVLAEHKDVHFYLQNYFADSQVGSLYFSWRRMKCKPIPEKIKALSDGNLTSILSGTTSAWFPNTKCAYRLNGVKVTKVHEPQKLLPGFTTIWTYKEEIYIAHLRNYAVSPNKSSNLATGVGTGAHTPKQWSEVCGRELPDGGQVIVLIGWNLHDHYCDNTSTYFIVL